MFLRVTLPLRVPGKSGTTDQAESDQDIRK